MTTGPVLSPPAGWYPDPAGSAAQRWWDGAAWSEHLVYPQPTQSDVPASPVASSVVGPPAGRWGLWDIGWATLVVVGTTLLGVVVIGVVVVMNPNLIAGNDLRYDTPAVAWALVVSQALTMLGLAAWPIIAATWKGDGWRRSFGFLVNGRAWLIGGLGGIATFLTLSILTFLATLVFGEPIDSAAADVVTQISGVTLAYAVFLVFIAIGSPFVEEMAFRGLMWGAIVKRGWSPWLATGVSAVCFGAFHFEPLRLVPLIAAGVVLGTVRHYAGIGASMLSHVIVNTIGVVALLLTT